jgi:general secretion pathway protein C
VALDTLIKKFFPAIIGVIIALIAYLQASGLVELVAQAVFSVEQTDVPPENPRPRSGSVSSHTPPKSASKVIAHNFFDHETDLNPKPAPTVDPASLNEAKPPTGIDTSDPLNVEQCAGVEVQIITESPDPTWSIAVLKGPKEERPFLRRVGDKVEDFEVQYIGYNRLQRSPAVWMSQSNRLCQSLLFTTSETAPSASSAAPSTPPPASTGKAEQSEVSDDIAKGIEKVSETEFNVDRSVVDSILENQAQLMRSARIVPEKGADGKTVGIRLFGVRPNTLLGTLGLQNGDRLETINGFEMASPEKALEAYARLRSANELTIKITRRGQPVTLDFNIK